MLNIIKLFILSASFLILEPINTIDFNSLTESEEIVIIKQNIAFLKNNYDSANDSILSFAKQNLKNSKILEYSEGIYQCHYYIAQIFQQNNQTDSALYYYQTGMDEHSPDYDFKAQYLWDYANLLWISGNYLLALENNLILKDLVESGKTNEYSYQVYNGLGRCYESLLEFDLAIQNFNKSLDLAKEQNEVGYIGKILTNLGGVYFSLNNYETALDYLKRGVKIEENNHFYFNACISNNYIAEIYIKTNALDSAKKYIQKASQLSKKSEDKIAVGITYYTMGNYYFHIGKYEDAKNVVTDLIIVAKESNYKELLKDSYLLLSKVNAKLGDFQSAYISLEHYFKVYNHLYDIEEINKAKAVEQKLLLQKKESDFFKLRLEKQKIINALLIALVILSLVIVIIGLIYLLKFRRLSKDLKESKEKAEESDQLKSRFLQTISHEIRTPLNGIIGFSEMIRNKSLNDQEMEQINVMMIKNSDDLISTIENLVDIAHLSSNQYNIKLSQFKLIPLLENIVKIAEENVVYRNKKELTLHLKKDQNMELHSDKNIIQKILLHLIKNAILYTEKGSITIGYKKEKSEVILFVKDTGIGVSKEKIDQIFSPFQQADENINIKVGGTGLGLTIVNGLIQILNGKIWVGSEVKKGSTFYISLPLAE